MRTRIAWGLMIAAILCLAGIQIFQPFRRLPQDVASTELYPIGRDGDGTEFYWILKEEVRDWIEIFCKATPLVATIMAFFLKGKKEEKKSGK